MLNTAAAILETIEINPDTPPVATIIWLHGLGADANDFVPIIPELKLPKNLPLRFVFPNAPMQPVTINNGYVMRSWYDIVSIDAKNHADQAGISTSIQHITQLIEREQKAGMPAERIFLAGFSQGAVIALSTGITYAKRLGGILALSGYLPLAEQVMAAATTENKSIPIFLAHGTQDNVVPYFLGEATLAVLTKNNYRVEWHNYAMGHSVCAEELQDIQKWLCQIVMK